jgi:hypothetical protein
MRESPKELQEDEWMDCKWVETNWLEKLASRKAMVVIHEKMVIPVENWNWKVKGVKSTETKALDVVFE